MGAPVKAGAAAGSTWSARSGRTDEAGARKAWRAQAPLPGVARNHAWLKRRTAALNLRNLPGKGLTRRDGAWVLAT